MRIVMNAVFGVASGRRVGIFISESGISAASYKMTSTLQSNTNLCSSFLDMDSIQYTLDTSQFNESMLVIKWELSRTFWNSGVGRELGPDLGPDSSASCMCENVFSVWQCLHHKVSFDIFTKKSGACVICHLPLPGQVGTRFWLDLNSGSNHQDLNIATGPANDHRCSSLEQRQIFWY